MMYKNGVPLAEQRICQPYGDDQRKGLDQFKALEYETWAKVLNRVNGVNFGNVYCKTSALGDIKSCKPDFMTWQQYTVFLLESIGLYNSDLMMYYYKKIKKFMIWHRKKYGIDIDEIPEEESKKLESQKKVISWRRIARAIEKNDFYLKRLSFAPTKTEKEELRKLVHKWDNMISENTITSDPHLSKFIKEEMANNDNKNE